VLVLSEGDFTNTFDLKDTAQEYIYSVEVSDKATFVEMLQAQEIPFAEQGKFVKLELNEKKYRELFKQAVARDVEFYQIKKESKFVELTK